MQFFRTHLPPHMSSITVLERMQIFFRFFFLSNVDSAPLSPLSAFEREKIYECVCRLFFRMQTVKEIRPAIFPHTLNLPPHMSPLSAFERMQIFFSYFFLSNAESAPFSPLSAFERKLICACVCRLSLLNAVVKKNEACDFSAHIYPHP